MYFTRDDELDALAVFFADECPFVMREENKTKRKRRSMRATSFCISYGVLKVVPRKNEKI